ncbi:carbohydrate ABC transporter permease [Occultella gossypii]|uniref:Sugar ABC transporter permease n=1 Tax=Occultella gossypii TaxID=2800820 RepID=A0ABS7S7R2_9MICO|nr:sugar ABC transporter permease [Occultella gossypii]MBZ2196399.1 sugar ABC transporter permease [Occultella gossypii]
MSVKSSDPLVNRHGLLARMRRGSTPYLLLAPTMVLLLVFLLYPLLSIGYFSLQQYNVSQPWDNGFIGLDNFRAMLADDLFWSSLVVTAKWVVVQVGLQLVFGLVLALIVNEAFRGRGLARAVLFSPWAVSGVLTTTIWLLLYNPAVGVNRYLADLGLGEYGTSLLASGDTAFWAAVLAELWRGVPFFTILILADLQSAPGELYEAAQVDGAGRIRRFWSITLPHLRNSIILATLLRGVWEFNNVDLLYTLTGGGPANATTTLPLYVARVAIDSKEFGYGSALTIAAFVILGLVTVLYLKLTNFGREPNE